jgi:hypothetical protein
VVAQKPSKLLGRVRFPSPALSAVGQASHAAAGAVVARRVGLSSPDHGEWRSLVAHPAGGRAVAGSNPVSPTSEKPANHTYRPRHQERFSPSWTFIGRLTLVVRAEIGGVISPPPLPLGAVGASVATQSIGLLEAKRQRLLEFEEPLEQLAREVARNGADLPFSGRACVSSWLRRGVGYALRRSCVGRGADLDVVPPVSRSCSQASTADSRKRRYRPRRICGIRPARA